MALKYLRRRKLTKKKKANGSRKCEEEDGNEGRLTERERPGVHRTESQKWKKEEHRKEMLQRMIKSA